MSKRPTNRQTLISNSLNNTNYAIIGDTVSATLYAKRLLANGVTTNIVIFNEGIDRININNITDTNFVANNSRRMLHYLNNEMIHLIPNTQNESNINTQNDQVFQYYIGSGPLGDFISAYIIPRLGPWFNYASNNRLDKFFNDYTIKSSLNSQELIVTSFLQNTWNLTSTSSIIASGPSILNCHYEFLDESNNILTRELFLNEYNSIIQANNLDYATEADGIIISTGTTAGTYNITNSDDSINNARLIWKTNPYTYLRLATESGLNPSQLYVPTFYRAILSIPLNNTSSNIDLTNLSNDGDLVTTHIAFSLNDINNPKQAGLCWLMQVYSSVEDLSVVDLAGKYADTGYTLLIVEGLCTKNKRASSYYNGEVQVSYNDRVVEYGYLKQFATIVATVYQAYTGIIITPDSLISSDSVCTVGTCSDGNSVVDYSLRESPMVTIIRTASQLYGLDVYPSKF